MKYILTIYLLFIFNQANAAFYNGNDLLEICKSETEINDKEISKEDKCASYIAGIYDAYFTFNKWGLIADTLCFEDTMKIEDLVNVSIKHIKAKPDELNMQAGSLVLNALVESFPCN